MVPNSYGSAINRFRCPAPVESGRRCGGADLDYRVVRSHIRSPGNISWLPPAQLTDIASTLVSKKICSSFRSCFGIQASLGRVRFFARPIASAVVLLERNATWRARLGDYSTALEYETSHVLRRIRDGEDNPIFLMPWLYEESFRY